MKIAVSGHRPSKLDNDYAGTGILSEKIYDELRKIVERNKDKPGITLITGMAQGVDTLFAWVAIDMKIPFIAAIPFLGQEKRWPETDQKVYRDLINNPLCTKKIISEGGYSWQAMDYRNRWMVDNCDGLIAVWDGSDGGTKNCRDYAYSIKKPIIRIDPDVLRGIS